MSMKMKLTLKRSSTSLAGKSSSRGKDISVEKTASMLLEDIEYKAAEDTYLHEIFFRDYSSMNLKPDHEQRPVWVLPNRRLILETFSPIYEQAKDFLIAISDPVTRPRHIHEYKITPYSLYAAASLGLRTDDILTGLRRMAKNELAKDLIMFIVNITTKAGKVRLLLRRNHYFLESMYRDMLTEMLKVKAVRDSRVGNSEMSVHDHSQHKIQLQGTKDGGKSQLEAMGLADTAGLDDKVSRKVYSFEILPEKVEQVKKECRDAGFPMLEEYDFRNDHMTPNLDINLRPFAQIRSYQEKSLSKMFGNGRGRSGIIVLPCGAGKTLVGITAAQTIAKSTLVFCTTAVAVEQWKKQFEFWTTVNDGRENRVFMFTADHRQRWDTTKPVIVITTYNQVGYGGSRNVEASYIMKLIEKQEWGLILLDEVHVAPAKSFRKCVGVTHSRCKLGLTATLIREDALVDDLYYLVGPKLYEANWLDLQDEGYIATVQCIQVSCKMTPEFYQKYLEEPSHSKKRLLYWMNPTKFRVCQYLINYHESRGDKVLVFSDNRYSLENFANTLGRAFIHGETKDTERLKTLEEFQNNEKFNTLFISKIGDNSIDLPDVNVIIQISSHYAARRQEAQRLGRILRPKPVSSNRFNAFFYTLISRDTMEVKYGTKRQRFLVDQGYSFRVIQDHELLAGNEKGLRFSTKEEQKVLLANVLFVSEEEGVDEADEEGVDSLTKAGKRKKGGSRWGGRGVVRRRGDASSLSGAGGASYQPKKKQANAPKFFRDRLGRK